ncbi:hypothetical protein [Algoriphagus sp.]|uniref:hypothetical protein n=1 Tax=Algoriphagus sp. TaxID=1872435 RepID=UPI00391B4535
MEENQVSENEKDLSNKEVINSLKKKNWTSYFKEFFMLFLAVFCGFLAENYRGNMVEKQQERQFIQSYIEDLKSDTASIKQVLDRADLKKSKMDSLMFLLKNQTIEGHENELYFFGRILMRGFSFQSNDRTFSQLKNSGSIRLIRNKQATDSIMAYQKLVEQLAHNYEDAKIERYEALNYIIQIFDPFVFDKMVTETGIRRTSGNPPLRSYDSSLQQALAHWAHQLKGSDFLISAKLKRLNESAIELIALLTKEYDLE